MLPHAPARPLLQLAEQIAQFDPVRLSAVISMLPVEALLAVRVGLDVALDRADQQLAELLRADYPAGRYHRTHQLPEHLDILRHRYPPNGDRDEWITHGPAGARRTVVAA